MSKSSPTNKSFVISKQLVWEAYQRVRANQGAPGVDGQTVAAFEADLKDNLYRIWNRMSSGTYFPPPVRAVGIAKPHGGTRMLGVPTVADRIAQTVVALTLEPRTEQIFHADSYGYRPGRSAHHALAACRGTSTWPPAGTYTWPPVGTFHGHGQRRRMASSQLTDYLIANRTARALGLLHARRSCRLARPGSRGRSGLRRAGTARPWNFSSEAVIQWRRPAARTRTARRRSAAP